MGRGSTRGMRVALELSGVAAALVLGLVMLACVASTPRSFILLYDGDSMMFALIRASEAIGQPQNWVLSSPLLIPESAIYLPIGLLGLPTRTTFVVDALANWVLYYLCLRAVAGLLFERRSAAVLGSSLAVAAITLCAITETSADRNSLQPASFLATTTYYSGTVLGVLVGCALLAACLRPARRPRLAFGLLAVATVVSTLTNPLFIAWGVVPFVAAAALLALLRRRMGPSIRAALTAVAVLLGGAGLGLIGRIPFASIAVQDNAAKIQPEQWHESAQYYTGLLFVRLSTLPGVIEYVIVLVMFAVTVVGLVASIRRRWVVGAVVSAVAAIGSVAVPVGAIALGTYAARYLEPVVFFPAVGMLPLVVLAAPAVRARLERWRVPAHPRLVGAVALVVAVAAAAVSIPFIAAGTGSVVQARSVACVDRWIEASGETGVGQYWTVRAPKADLADPRQLVQIDPRFNGYSWLINTDDLSRRRASFLLTDDQSAPVALPSHPASTGTVTCGSYTIIEYPTGSLRIGPSHH